MAHTIISVDAGSPAERAGIKAGDELITIDGERVADFIDYQALCAHTRLDIETRAGRFHIKKGEYDDLGLNFETAMMSPVRLCANKCRFCFVDQLPEYARESLRVKDDDWRMSLMMGNYVSLTNVGDRELDRIIRRRVSPIYISVHAIDPDLRAEIMGTRLAAKLPEQLKKLAEGGIAFHAQAVLCPDMNDGAELEKTISFLADMMPACRSFALVPVGLTGCREGLYPLRKYTRDEARAVIETADKWRKTLLEKAGTRFVFPSDEFYLAAETELPEDEEYEDYGQIDDGVGMLRLFSEQFISAWKEAEFKPARGERKCAIVCGVSAKEFFAKLTSLYEIPGAKVDVFAAKNHFFGESVTVSGLVTGGDILREMRGKDYEDILISETMLRQEDGVFLDGMTVKELENALGARITPVGRDGAELVRAITEIAEGKNG